MMYLSTSTTRLYWKELRQVIPLVVALLSLTGLLMLVVTYETDPHDVQVPLATLSLVPPILFAVGAGTSMIGKDKESRSLTWLTSLPIGPRNLVLNPFIIGLVWLLGLWIIAALFQVSAASFFDTVFPDQISVGFQFRVFINSFYLLICGFTTAWMARSSLLGLLAVLPLAVIPAAINTAIMYAYTKLQDPPRYFIDEEPLWLTIIMTVLGMIVVGRIGYHIAMRELAGNMIVAPSGNRQSFGQWVTAGFSSVNDRLRGDLSTTSQSPTAATSLIWQFRNQNRAMVIGIYAVLLLCAPFVWLELNSLNQRSYDLSIFGTLCLIIAYCTLSWMAMLAFHGDNVSNRVRFLAERGVSPSRVWWTRHLVPVGFLVVYMLGLFFVVPIKKEIDRSLEPTMYQGAVGIAILYAISQWIGQLIKPAALAALIAPIAATAAALFGMSLTLEYGTSLPILSVSMVGIPLFATWWMMPRWMDGRGGFGYWLRHGALLALALLVVIFPYCYAWLTVSEFSYTERSQLRRESDQYAASFVQEVTWNVDQSVPLDWRKVEDVGKQQTLRLAEVDLASRRRREFERLSYLATDKKLSVPALGFEITVWQSHVATLRFSLDVAGDEDDDAAAIEKQVTEYREWMRLGQRLVAGMRRSSHLASQENADWWEILLLVELNHPETRERLDAETFAAIVRQVGAVDERWEARRKALMLSYRKFEDDAYDQMGALNLGGIVIDRIATDQNGVTSLATPYNRLVYRRHCEKLFKTLLTYIDEARRGAGEYPGAYLADFTKRSPQLYGAPPAGTSLRIDDVNNYSGLHAIFSPTIATQWGAGWEQQGREWLEQL